MKLPSGVAFILLVAAFRLPFATPARAAADLTYTAAQIVFNHPGPYTQAQLETAAGMHAGTRFKADDLGAAAQRLIDTGFFVQCRRHALRRREQGQRPLRHRAHRPRPDAARRLRKLRLAHPRRDRGRPPRQIPALFRLSPRKQPARGHLQRRPHRRASRQGHPRPGRLTTPSSPPCFAPSASSNSASLSPAIRVANVKLDGVSPDLAPLIQKSVNAAVRAPYNQGLAGETTEDRILTPLLDAGYIQASLSDISLSPALSGDTASVVLSATLTPGDIYRVSSITFAGTPLLSAESFTASENSTLATLPRARYYFETLKPRWTPPIAGRATWT